MLSLPLATLDVGRMALNFSVINTAMSQLWDHGWFDLTHFKIEGPTLQRQDPIRVIRDFLRDPISQCSFCTPGPWGESVQRHGPFLHEKLVAEWFRPVTAEELANQIKTVLDTSFAEPPQVGQQLPVKSWVQTVKARGDTLFALEVPDQQDIRVEWHLVWDVFEEFVAIGADRQELAIGVIGYD